MIEIPHPVNRQIATYYYLGSLIANYKSYVDSWRDSALKEIRTKAKEFSEGDREIEADIYSQESRVIYEQTEFEELLFYKSMLIMVYSYYESIIHRMAIDVGVKEDRPSLICDKIGKALSSETKDKIDYIWNYVRLLRNHLCHNDSGTKDKDEECTKKSLNWLCQNKYIEMGDNLGEYNVYYISKDFILDVLTKEHYVLLELSKIIGYKGYNC